MSIAVNANITSGDIASSAATFAVTKPTGTASTDILILVVAVDRTATTPPVPSASGWTEVVANFLTTSGSADVRLATFWALGNVANLTFTSTGLTGAQIGWVCLGFTGVDNTTPIDATGTTSSSTGSATVTANAVTVATANAWHLISVCDWLGGGTDTFTATSFTRKQNAGSNATAGLLYNTTPKSTGSTGTVTVTSSDSASGQVLAALPFALRPDSPAAVVFPWQDFSFRPPAGPTRVVPY